MGKIVKTVKMVGSLAVSVGIGSVATNVIMAVMPPGAGLVTRGCIKVGTYAISGLAATEAGKQFGRKVDLITTIVEKTMGDIKEDQEKIKLTSEEENEEMSEEDNKVEKAMDEMDAHVDSFTYNIKPEDVEE